MRLTLVTICFALASTICAVPLPAGNGGAGTEGRIIRRDPGESESAPHQEQADLSTSQGGEAPIKPSGLDGAGGRPAKVQGQGGDERNHPNGNNHHGNRRHRHRKHRHRHGQGRKAQWGEHQPGMKDRETQGGGNVEHQPERKDGEAEGGTPTKTQLESSSAIGS